MLPGNRELPHADARLHGVRLVDDDDAPRGRWRIDRRSRGQLSTRPAAEHTLRSRLTCQQQLDIRAIGELAELVGNIEVRIVDRVHGSIGAHQHAKRFLRELNLEQRLLDARLVAQELLLCAQHVQPAAKTALQARVGEVEMCLRVVARPGVQVEHAASRDDREVRLPRRNGNLPLHILLVLLRDDDLVAGLIALRPRHRRQNRHAQRGRRLRLHAGHDGRRACACIEFHRVGEVGRQRRGERRERRGPHLLEDCFGAHDARGRLRDGRVVLRRAIDRLRERQSLHRLRHSGIRCNKQDRNDSHEQRETTKRTTNTK